MPFQQSSQKVKRDPNFRDEQAISAIRLKLTDLENMIRSYAGTNKETQQIIGAIRQATQSAIDLILSS